MGVEKLVTVPVKLAWTGLKALFSPSYVDDIAGAGANTFSTAAVTKAATKAGQQAAWEAGLQQGVAKMANTARVPLAIGGGALGSFELGVVGYHAAQDADLHISNNPAASTGAGGGSNTGGAGNNEVVWYNPLTYPNAFKKKEEPSLSASGAMLFAAIAGLLGLGGTWISGGSSVGTMALVTGGLALAGAGIGAVFGGEMLKPAPASTNNTPPKDTQGEAPAQEKSNTQNQQKTAARPMAEMNTESLFQGNPNASLPTQPVGAKKTAAAPSVA